MRSCVSHLLPDHLTWKGAGQSLLVLLVLLVISWAWNYTTWATNELDPESIAVRLMLIGLMLANMLMAIAIPEAWGDRALLFVGSYVVIQVGRSLFLTFIAAEAGTEQRAAAGRILAWFAMSGVLCRRISSRAWSLRTDHFTERFGLFIVIALGESIVVTDAINVASPRRWKSWRRRRPSRIAGCTTHSED